MQSTKHCQNACTADNSQLSTLELNELGQGSLISGSFESRNLPVSPRLNESPDELHEKIPENPERSEFLIREQ